MALLVASVVLLVRLIGIFAVTWMAGGGKRLACLATINLSQVSEFALVICCPFWDVNRSIENNEPEEKSQCSRHKNKKCSM